MSLFTQNVYLSFCNEITGNDHCCFKAKASLKCAGRTFPSEAEAMLLDHEITNQVWVLDRFIPNFRIHRTNSSEFVPDCSAATDDSSNDDLVKAILLLKCVKSSQKDLISQSKSISRLTKINRLHIDVDSRA